MAPTLSFDRLRSILVATVTQLPDQRTRPNRIYEMADAALGAFAVFFMQSPSFLAHQRDMQRTPGAEQRRRACLASIRCPVIRRSATCWTRSRPSSWRRPSGGCSSSCGTAITSQAYQGHLGPLVMRPGWHAVLQLAEDPLCAMHDAGGQRPHLLLRTPWWRRCSWRRARTG